MEPKIPAAKRFIFVDSVRGIAALAVACYHFYGLLCLPSNEPLWGMPLHHLLTHGDLGVFVFFVLSGMVIACSLHESRIDGLLVGKFALRRSLRLDPSYWATIAITYLFLVLLNARGFGQESGLPSATDVVANMFYLDNLLGFKSIVKVGWTLCLEIQFYLVFVLLGWLAGTIGRGKPSVWLRAVVFLPLAIWSLAVYGGFLPLEQVGTFVPYWFMYFLGVLVWWTLSRQVPAAWLWGGVGLSAVIAFTTSNSQVWVAIATALTIFFVGWTGRMDTLLTGRAFRYLGRISYSFYLLHPLVGNNFLRVVQRVRGVESTGPAMAAVLFLAAMAISVLAAHLLYKLVESPSHRLSRRIRWSTGTAAPLEASAVPLPGDLPVPADVAAPPPPSASASRPAEPVPPGAASK